MSNYNYNNGDGSDQFNPNNIPQHPPGQMNPPGMNPGRPAMPMHPGQYPMAYANQYRPGMPIQQPNQQNISFKQEQMYRPAMGDPKLTQQPMYVNSMAPGMPPAPVLTKPVSGPPTGPPTHTQNLVPPATMPHKPTMLTSSMPKISIPPMSIVLNAIESYNRFRNYVNNSLDYVRRDLSKTLPVIYSWHLIEILKEIKTTFSSAGENVDMTQYPSKDVKDALKALMLSPPSNLNPNISAHIKSCCEMIYNIKARDSMDPVGDLCTALMKNPIIEVEMEQVTKDIFDNVTKSNSALLSVFNGRIKIRVSGSDSGIVHREKYKEDGYDFSCEPFSHMIRDVSAKSETAALVVIDKIHFGPPVPRKIYAEWLDETKESTFFDLRETGISICCFTIFGAQCAKVSKNGKHLAAATSNSTIYLWDLAESVDGNPAAEAREIPQTILVGHSEDVLSLDFSPDSLSLISTAPDYSIRQWAVAQKFCVRKVDTTHTVNCLKYHPLGGLYAAGTSDEHTPFIYNSKSAQPVRILPFLASEVTCVCWHPRGKCLAYGSIDGEVSIADIESSNTIRNIPRMNSMITALSFSPDGMSLAIGTSEGDISIYYFSIAHGTTRIFHQRKFHKKAITCFAFSEFAEVLATGGDDGIVRVIDNSFLREEAEVPLPASFNSDMEPKIDPPKEVSLTDDRRILCGVYPIKNATPVLDLSFTRQNVLIAATKAEWNPMTKVTNKE